MNNYPLVSLIILSYNNQKYLKYALKSCLVQSYKNIEIIISDDCSKDLSKVFLLKIKKKFKDKMKININPKNFGITKNLNLSLKICTGKYVIFMGGDDLIDTDKVKKQVQFMEDNHNCAICYHNMRIINENKSNHVEKFNNKNNIFNGGLKVLIKNGSFNCGTSNMYRSSLIPKKGFDERLKFASDWLFSVQCLEGGYKIFFLNETLGSYRKHQNNITNSTGNILHENELDSLNSCLIMCSYYPKYIDEIFIRFSNLMYMYRYKINYSKCLKIKLLYDFEFKILIKLFIHYLSFKKLNF